MIAARNLCAAVARKSIILSQDRMNGAWLRASFLGMAQGLNKAPLCTNIEALFVEMDFLRATGSLANHNHARHLHDPHSRPSAGGGRKSVANGDEW